jgi:hypothetical protein
VRTAAETFVPNLKVDVAATISTLGVGEALVSTLQEKGVPMPVEKTLVCPPRCRMGALTPEERAAVKLRSPVGIKYDTPVNRESAYEILNQRVEALEAEKQNADKTASNKKSEKSGFLNDFLWGTKRRQGMVETMAKQTARTVGSQIGRQIIRGLMGSIMGGSKR